MKSIRLQNFKCLEDTSNVEIKPLTMLVGANSSGKSSFLRFFPLLKQSVVIKKRGSLLWFGDLVDFQDFKNTVRNGENTIRISMKFKNLNMYREAFMSQKFPEIPISLDIELSSDKQDFDKIKELTINYNDLPIKIISEKENEVSLLFDDANKKLFEDVIETAYKGFSLIPNMFFKEGDYDYVTSYSSKCRNAINGYIKKYKINNELLSISRYDKSGIIHLLDRKTFYEQNKRSNPNLSDVVLDNLYKRCIYYHINFIIDEINNLLAKEFANITYIGPFRKSIERFYRIRNVGTYELDADGANLAMYINNLSDNDKKLLNAWLKAYFNIEIEVVTDRGNMEIQIKEKNGKFRNLIDVGFGMSQALPILIDIWESSYRRSKFNRYGRKIIVIEQPELHLHPRFQVAFVEMLTRLLNKSNMNDVSFIIETHSEIMINKIGAQVAYHKIKNEDVQILLFNAKEEGFRRQVEFASYTKDGYLSNWPIGFFSGL